MNNTPITGTIGPTPQNATLGAIANFLKQAYAPQRTQQMQGVAEFLGLPAVAREVENWSYGNYPMRINPNAGRTASFVPEVKPGRKSDLADTLLLGLDVAPLASLAGKGAVRGARALEDATIGAAQRARIRSAAAKVPDDTAYDPLRQRMEASGNLAYSVKPKGGNWRAESIDDSTQQFRQTPDWLGGEIINDAAGENLWARMVKEGGHQDPHAWLRKNRPDVYNKMVGPEGTAINRWLDTKLNKYIRNEMGTPDDPVLALAEKGTLHFRPQGIRDESPIMDKVRQRRQLEGYPQEGTATTPLGQQWERYSDYAIEPKTAGQIVDQAQRGAFRENRERAQRFIEENPWIEKLDPEARVYGTQWEAFDNEALGFGHLVDELKNAMNPATDLPRNLRIDPKDIDKITMPQAVERVAQINAWRAKQAAEAEKAGMLGNLQAKPRLPDDSLQLSFVDKPGGAWVDIPETVDEKGMALCNSIGKAGGWCTQSRWAAESYGSGENRLVALVDTEGRPHAQAKLTQDVDEMSALDSIIETMTPRQEAAYDKHFSKFDRPPELREMVEWMMTEEPALYKEFKAVLSSQPKSPPSITELKPPGNTFDSDRAKEYIKRDPDYKTKVTDSVVRFLNSGDWGKVNDLHHYDIVDLRDPKSLMDGLTMLYGDESTTRVGREFIDAFNNAVHFEPDANRFMTLRQLREFIGPVEPLEGYAGGGLVKGAVKSIGEMVEKYLAKEAPAAASTVAPKEQKMLQGFYRGYAGDYDAAKAAEDAGMVFVTPQRAAGEFYANKRARQMGLDPHLEMILADPFAGYAYGHAIPTGPMNRKVDFTKARQLKPTDVKDRTQLYARGGSVNYDPDEIAQMAERTTQGFAAGGLVDYDPNEIDTIVSRMKEEFHG